MPLGPVLILAILGAIALPASADVRKAAGDYSVSGYRYGGGELDGDATLTIDRTGASTLTLRLGGTPGRTEVFTGTTEQRSPSTFHFSGTASPVHRGAIESFQQRVAKGVAPETLTLLINLRIQSSLGLLKQATPNGGTRFRGQVRLLRNVGFGDASSKRERRPATAPASAVQYFLSKEYPADVRDLDAELSTARPSPHASDALGRLVVFVPGMFNRAPSPGVAFRAARHSERVFIAYSNGRHAAQNTVRVVEELEGIPVPTELAGKILAIGSPQPTISSWLHTSDLLLEQLEELRESESLLGFPLLEAEATVIGHCQGGLAALHVQRRLEALGYPRVIKRKVALATPGNGLDYFGAQTVASWVNPGGESVHAAIADLTAARVAEVLGAPGAGTWFDVAVSGQKPDSDGDGLVSTTSAARGAEAFRNAGALDHGQIFRRSRVVDLILDALAR